LLCNAGTAGCPDKECAVSYDEDQARDIFLEAVDKATPAERAAFLDVACAGHADLRRRVDALLAADDRSDGILEDSDGGPDGTSSVAPAAGSFAPGHYMHEDLESAGDRVGPYTLVQKLGEGGMGTVWIAEQHTPVKRRVALKLIKAGLDTKLVLRRFDAERQAVALMDHSNIAKVLDAGATAAGRPYFVMELVQGVPITRYCDECQLPVRERLQLFVSVCLAIQHAHQKGIIHRDIKPSNVLVSVQDGKPVPKVIDFGVAKAIHQRLTDTSIYTQVGMIVGSLQYMSPEQAEMSPRGVDTRADVYALGVLLYELLTGYTPLDMQRLHEAVYSEVLRLIKEEVPLRPSTRLTQSRESLAGVAAARRTEPARLEKELRGDLDWITMRALEKDCARRYEAASVLARDVERHLQSEPVDARPPTALYRLSKFWQRNKGVVAAAAVVFLSLVGGIIGTSWGMVRAERARRDAEDARRAEAEQRRRSDDAAAAEKVAKETAVAKEAETHVVLDFVLEKIFAAARPRGQEGGLGKDVTMRDAVEAAVPFVEKSFQAQPLIEARLRMEIGRSFFFLGRADAAVPQFQVARAIYTRQLGTGHPDTLRAMRNLANGYSELGRPAEALNLRKETLEQSRAALGADHEETLANMNNLASSYSTLGRPAEALKLFEETVRLRKAALEPDDPETLRSMYNVARCYAALRRYSDAAKLHQETLELRKAKLGPDHPDTLSSMNNLADCYAHLGRKAEALQLQEETLKRQKAVLGPDHPETLASMNNVATSYEDAGRVEECFRLREETYSLLKAKLGSDHPRTLIGMNNLASSYAKVDRLDEAMKLLAKALAAQKVKLGPHHPDTLLSMLNIAAVQVQMIPKAADKNKQTDLAMQWLKDTVAAGFNNVELIKTADEFVPLRGRADFRHLVEELESKSERENK
jgi:serine/threonine protein kinase/tetratricopeptide (TPR) repeat protein